MPEPTFEAYYRLADPADPIKTGDIFLGGVLTAPADPLLALAAEFELRPPGAVATDYSGPIHPHSAPLRDAASVGAVIEEPLVGLGYVTVPAPHGAEFAHAVGARTTFGVLIEILAGAKRRVVLAAPFLQEAHGLSDPRVTAAIQSCLERGVEVDVVSTRESLDTLHTVDFRKSGRAKLRLFRPEANVEDEWHIGSHAKFCIADTDAAYIGSANFTGPALDGQLELGLLVRGKAARQIAAFWRYCLRRGVFVPVE